MTRINPLARRQGEAIALASHQQVTLTELKYNYELIAESDRTAVMDATARIKANGRRAIELARRGRQSILEMGRDLIQVKAVLPHGQFGDWCETEFKEEFGLSQKTAERMMNTAQAFGDKFDTVANLSDSAMYLLAAPSVPEAARAEVITQAQAQGKSPTKAQVNESIKRHTVGRGNGGGRIATKVSQADDGLVAPATTWVTVDGELGRTIPETPQSAPAVGRNAKLLAAVEDCQAFVVRLEEIGQLTGQLVACGRARREIDLLVDALRRACRFGGEPGGE